MTDKLTCIICPNSCEMQVLHKQCKIIEITGASCERGAEYARQEYYKPMRMLTSSVKVLNGEEPLVSVKLNKAILRSRLPEMMEIIKQLSVEAPIKCGEVLASDIWGEGIQIVATKNVDVNEVME